MGGRSSTFVDATPARPCPVCGATKRCQSARDGRTIICYRSDTWNGRLGHYLPVDPLRRSLAERWSWYIGPRDGTRFDPPPELPPDPMRELASIEVRDHVYSAILGEIELADAHLDALTLPWPSGRGLPIAEVRRRQYRSLPDSGPPWVRENIARRVFDRFGEDALHVPGVVRRTSRAGKPYLTLSGYAGLLVPVRDLAGRIQGLQVRVDAQVDGGKYRWLTSVHDSGPAAVPVCHVPFRVAPHQPIVRITEGPLKADAATIHDPEGLLTLAFPGTATWSVVLEALEKLRPETVRFAFDSDWRTNPDVSRDMAACYACLGERGFRREFELWSGPKGIDDLFASGSRPEVARAA